MIVVFWASCLYFPIEMGLEWDESGISVWEMERGGLSVIWDELETQNMEHSSGYVNIPE